ncbi:MAG TPA: CDP-archaeol synthase [Pseudomonadales bacterium]|nr:CDP-archaeol synthase [Pseudomonadales bacterium]
MLQICLLLLLVGAANTAPLVAKKLFGSRWAAPLDCGVVLPDGAPLFGASKTVRGALVGVLAPTLLAPLVGHTLVDGCIVGIGAMTGDLLSSFLKRRMHLPPSGRAVGLDQLPEVLLPAWLARDAFALSGVDIALTGALFFVLEVVLAKVAFRIRLRDRPY